MVMPKSVQIREVPEEVVTTIRVRAAAAGMSMSEYLRAGLITMASTPTVAEVLERARARHGGASTESIVAVIREARGE